jgi:hypothetical protein
MTEPKSLTKPEKTVDTVSDMETSAGRKLTILPPPPQHREPRPVTNLGRIFGQFAELRQQMAEQVVALEDSVYLQNRISRRRMRSCPSCGTVSIG